MNDGFIKIPQRLFNSAIWQNQNDWRLASALYFMANWKAGEFQDRNGDVLKVQRGQVVTSLASLKKATKLSFRNIRTCLIHLEKSGFSTSITTNHYSVITIVRYGEFDKDTTEVTSESTRNRQAPDKEPTTIEDIKDVKKLRSTALKSPQRSGDPRVAGLQKSFADLLMQKLGPEAKVNWGFLGRILKARLTAGVPDTQIHDRIRAWFESTDGFIVANCNNVGLFNGKFHLLKDGPIYDSKSSSGTRIAGDATPEPGKYSAIFKRD